MPEHEHRGPPRQVGAQRFTINTRMDTEASQDRMDAKVPEVNMNTEVHHKQKYEHRGPTKRVGMQRYRKKVWLHISHTKVLTSIYRQTYIHMYTYKITYIHMPTYIYTHTYTWTRSAVYAVQNQSLPSDESLRKRTTGQRALLRDGAFDALLQMSRTLAPQ